MANPVIINQLIRIISIIILSTAILIIFLAMLAPQPPIKEFEAFHKVLSEARELQVQIYAPHSYSNAEKFRNMAYNEWQSENEKPLLKRNYAETKRIILIALSLVEEVNENARVRTNEPIFSNELYNLTEAEIIRKNYKLHSEKWNSWTEEAINTSENRKSLAIIIEKYKRILHVYKSGDHIASFDVELGSNWLENKKYKGDNATPEGNYYVTSKKQSPQTPYSKSVMLNFPNRFDKERFESDKKRNLINDLNILNEKLEIHGHGGKGSNWTNGSIALEDCDIDSLFSMVKIGTPVVIVGIIE
ncbi:murein L,D-transpeptidase family protein [Bacteroidota bacterium]